MSLDITKAVNLFNDYKLDEAKGVFEELLKTAPKNIEILNYLGKISCKTQSYGEALNYFNRAIEIEPNNAQALTGLQLTKNILQLANNFYFENAYTNDDLYDF